MRCKLHPANGTTGNPTPVLFVAEKWMSGRGAGTVYGAAPYGPRRPIGGPWKRKPKRTRSLLRAMVLVGPSNASPEPAPKKEAHGPSGEFHATFRPGCPGDTGNVRRRKSYAQIAGSSRSCCSSATAAASSQGN